MSAVTASGYITTAAQLLRTGLTAITRVGEWLALQSTEEALTLTDMATLRHARSWADAIAYSDPGRYPEQVVTDARYVLNAIEVFEREEAT